MSLSDESSRKINGQEAMDELERRRAENLADLEERTAASRAAAQAVSSAAGVVDQDAWRSERERRLLHGPSGSSEDSKEEPADIVSTAPIAPASKDEDSALVDSDSEAVEDGRSPMEQGVSWNDFYFELLSRPGGFKVATSNREHRRAYETWMYGAPLPEPRALSQEEGQDEPAAVREERKGVAARVAGWISGIRDAFDEEKRLASRTPFAVFYEERLGKRAYMPNDEYRDMKAEWQALSATPLADPAVREEFGRRLERAEREKLEDSGRVLDADEVRAIRVKVTNELLDELDQLAALPDDEIEQLKDAKKSDVAKKSEDK